MLFKNYGINQSQQETKTTAETMVEVWNDWK